MIYFDYISRFAFDETGAVTIDWVILTAAVLGMAFVVVGIAQEGMVNLANAIADTLANIEVKILP